MSNVKENTEKPKRDKYTWLNTSLLAIRRNKNILHNNLQNIFSHIFYASGVCLHIAKCLNEIELNYC